jgi:uncharacterized protein (UPF0548 family)
VTTWHIGSGEQRFEWCEENLLSWRMIDAAGFRLEHVERSTEGGYAGAGATAFHTNTTTGEAVYDADGRGFITPGDVVTLLWGRRGKRRERHFRVVAVTRELNVVSVSLGTLDREPFVGEFLIGIEYHDDDTVWSRVIQVVAPGSSRTSRLLFPLILLILKRVRGRIARGLNPARVAYAREAVAGEDAEVRDVESGEAGPPRNLDASAHEWPRRFLRVCHPSPTVACRRGSHRAPKRRSQRTCTFLTVASAAVTATSTPTRVMSCAGLGVSRTLTW